MKFIAIVSIAIALGFLEAAWIDSASPANTWLGIFALLVIFLIITRPKIWRVTGLAIIEEGVHLIVGYRTLPSIATLFNHWSIGFLGFNIYPWITFPIITVIGELLYKLFKDYLIR